MPRVALEIAARERPDIILIDLDLYGIHVLKLIKDFKKAAHQSPILVLSGLMEGDLTQKALCSGAAGVVLKVQPPSILIAAIESLCSEGTKDVEPAPQPLERTALPHVPLVSEVDQGIERMNSLTAREREIIGLIGIGLRNKEIAHRLSISDITVRHHLTNIFSKLDVSDRQKLLVWAHHYHLVELTPYSHVT
jgi:DNA-binding NarL/FixJ family response regulator